ncbi:MAG: IPT/TIG domain-containing protein, partial [Myxococcota bacterium]
MKRAVFLGAATVALLLTASATTEAQSRPVIERLEPTSGPPGSTFDVVGRRLDNQSRFVLGGVVCPVLRRSPNRWTLRVPEGATSGTLVIEAPTGVYAGPSFRVTQAAAAPSITSVSPASAPAGSVVTLRGTGFSPRSSENRVTLGGRTVVVQSASTDTLRVIVPPGVA